MQMLRAEILIDSFRYIATTATTDFQWFLVFVSICLNSNKEDFRMFALDTLSD